MRVRVKHMDSYFFVYAKFTTYIIGKYKILEVFNMDMNNYNELAMLNEIDETEVSEAKGNETLNTIARLGVITLSTIFTGIGAITTAKYIGKKVKERRQVKTQQSYGDLAQQLIVTMIREGKTDEEIKMVIDTLRKISS